MMASVVSVESKVWGANLFNDPGMSTERASTSAPVYRNGSARQQVDVALAMVTTRRWRCQPVEACVR
jgi:CO/xanthine dehydrogenase FAD-binding subunit